MKIQYASDLHLELTENKEYLLKHPIKKTGDILILAGDIGYLNSTIGGQLMSLKGLSEYQHVFLIPGNHEFYFKSMDISDVLEGYKQQVGVNSYYLNNKVVYPSEGIRILFTTLWTHLDDEQLAEELFSDFEMSLFNGKSFTAKDYNYCHQACRDFLASSLSAPFSGKTIVVSHHAPFPAYYLPYRSKMKHEQLLHVDMTALIDIYPVHHWIYGHVHINFGTLKIGNTFFHTNQLGYVYRNHHHSYEDSTFFEV